MSENHVDNSMKARLLPHIPDLEIADEGVSTWHIERYRSLRSKERGPTFTCGGHPWYMRLLTMACRGSVDLSVGEYYSSQLVITWTLHRYIWNKAEKKANKKRNHQKGGLPACSSP